MLERDLDIVNLLKMIQGFRVMRSVLFSRDDNFFLNLQSRDVINSMSDQEYYSNQKKENLALLGHTTHSRSKSMKLGQSSEQIFNS